MKENIKIDEFIRCDIRVGTILSADFVEGADKLIVFKVDLNEKNIDEDGVEKKRIRQILSGIREYYPDPNILVGTQVPVLINLPTRKMKGLDSEGMILYAIGEGDNFKAISPQEKVENGTEIG